MKSALPVLARAEIALHEKNMLAGPNACAGLQLQLVYTTKEKGANIMKLSQIKAGQYFKFKDDNAGTVRRLLDIVKRPGLFEVERVTNKYWNDWNGFSTDLLFLIKAMGTGK